MKHLMQRKITNKWCWIVLILGTLCKLWYAIQVPYDVSPHDLGHLQDFYSHQTGHIDYILYMLNYRRLTTFTPYLYGQYYHPPLHYILSAGIIIIARGLGVNCVAAFELLQFMIMIVSCLTVVLIYRILCRLNISTEIRFALTLFFSFCPSFFHIGACINNDCLVTFLVTCAIYFTVIWIQKKNLRSIIAIAIAIGLATLSKTSGVLISPAVGMVFLYELIKYRKEWRKYLTQYMIFGLICIPLGMAWLIRENILFGVPFNYVLRVDDMRQYVGNLSLWTRMGIPSVKQMFSTSIDWTDAPSYSNIWGMTWFSLVFDEGAFQITNLLMWISAIALLWCIAGIWIVGCIFMVFFILNAAIEGEYRLLFSLGFLVILGFYITFAFQYPHLCSMNFRYIETTVVCLLTAYGLQTSNTKETRIHKVGNTLMAGMMGVAAVLSAMLFVFCAV